MCIRNKVERINIFDYINVVPYSVIGTQLTRDNTVVQKTPPPMPNCMFVDPAGIIYIKHFGPRSAGGASGAIYELLGIRKDFQFPKPVRKALHRPGDAYCHVYQNNLYHCCHVISPNFSTMIMAPSQNDALAILIRAYKNIFREFSRLKLLKLRLLPIAGGIFSGKFTKIIPQLTRTAIAQAVLKLNKRDYNHLVYAIDESQKNGSYAIQMCIYEESQFRQFKY